jgi:hypothetical protein
MARTLAALLAVLAALAVVAGCQPRLPLNRTEASAAARNWCVRDGLPWGDPVEVREPDAADADGRRWWMVRFAGEGRIALVNAETGWVKRGP